MHHHFAHWHKGHRPFLGCAPRGPGWHGGFDPGGGGDGGFDDGGSGFGVRRPLRFLAHKLELDEKQMAEFARIINDLKTERAQAEVDRRRTLAQLADAVEAEQYGNDQAAQAGALRVQSAEHLQRAVTRALQQIHGLLNGEQRHKLAYLIRSGTLTL